MTSTDGPSKRSVRVSADEAATHATHATHAEAGEAANVPLYPIFLKVAGKACLVVGGGNVAARKVAALVEAGARVTVVAPELGEILAEQAAAERPSWSWRARPFRDDDVAGCVVVVAATGDRTVNDSAATAARRAGVLVNVVDDPERCDFFVPAVVARGPLQIAVGTGGLAPGLAARLRERLEGEFPAAWGPGVSAVGAARRAVQSVDGLDEHARRQALHDLGSLDLGALLAEGGQARVDSAVGEVVARCTSRR